MAIRKRLKGLAKRLLGRESDDGPVAAPAPARPAAAPRPAPAAAPRVLHLETDDDDDESINVEVDSALVADWIDEGKSPLFVDIREIHEMEAGHIEHAWLMPMGDVPDRRDELPRERDLIIYCAQGARSYGVAHHLREQGLTAWSMVGGMGSWLALGGDQVIAPPGRAFRPVDDVRLTAEAAKRLSLGRDAATVQEIRQEDGAVVYCVAIGSERVGGLAADDLEKI
jgi:rhodanese-related sulfurtransferase